MRTLWFSILVLGGCGGLVRFEESSSSGGSSGNSSGNFAGSGGEGGATLLEACLAFCARASECDSFMGCDQSCAEAVDLVAGGCEDVYAASLGCFENVPDLCNLTGLECPDEEAELRACLEDAGGPGTGGFDG